MARLFGYTMSRVELTREIIHLGSYQVRGLTLDQQEIPKTTASLTEATLLYMSMEANHLVSYWYE